MSVVHVVDEEIASGEMCVGYGVVGFGHEDCPVVRTWSIWVDSDDVVAWRSAVGEEDESAVVVSEDDEIVVEVAYGLLKGST